MDIRKLDCSQSPIFPCDRRDRARLTVKGVLNLNLNEI